MSFRLRVLLLVVLVAVTTTAATAWVILNQASRQVSESVTADSAQLEQVKSELLHYAEQHGTWEGVARLVRDLGRRTGQRIHLVSESGVVIVDTDTEEGRTARPLGSARAYLDPRPHLSLTEDMADPAAETVKAVLAYRSQVRFAACLTRAGIAVTESTNPLGMPIYAATGTGPETREAVAECRPPAAQEVQPVSDAVARCSHPGPASAPAPATPGRELPTSPVIDCLNQVFTDQISDVAPVPALVYLGAPGEPTVALSSPPLIAAAIGVALVISAGTVLLSHRVLRPIGSMTAAAHRLGAGDLTSTVAVRGNDELAELGRSFNRMAGSLRRGEERQRQLIADVAHELRTPLANLRGYLEALSDGVITPDPQLFASLHEEALLQQRIVDDLQELALAEAGQLAYHRVPVDLVELLETCRTAHQATAAATGITLTVQPPAPDEGRPAASPPLQVHADPDRIRQVLGNLLTNALRATPADGSVTLQAEQDGANAVIRVVDTGTGIPPDSLDHVFDRFWRADPARGRQTGGAGLGLALARQIVTDHAGTIAVDSTVGLGTTFTVRLPLADHPDRATGQSPPRT